MRIADTILMRAFGRPRGTLGRLGGLLMARLNRRTAERAVALLEVRPGDRVLEIGFGPGVAVALLADASAPSGRVAGVDPSDEMLRQAAARNAGAIRSGRVDLRRATAESLPFEAGAFDRALSINSMQVWADPVQGLREIRRVLRPDARLVLAFTRAARQPRQGLAEMLATAGFLDARLVELGEDLFAAVATAPPRDGAVVA